MEENKTTKRLQYLEEQIQKINQRNQKVEIDKAWEISKFRTLSICFLIWVVIALVFWIIGVEHYFFNAVIPASGFYLSTLSLPAIKKCWLAKYFKAD